MKIKKKNSDTKDMTTTTHSMASDHEKTWCIKQFKL
jgi:hypothetical protein